MRAYAEESSVVFGPFRVDLAAARLFRDGTPQDLRPKAFRLLELLVRNPGRVVGYGEIIRDAWDGLQVGKHTVAVTIGEVKTALGAYGSWIACRPRFGYCFEPPEAEELLRIGRHFASQYTRVGFESALERFQEAVQTDSMDFRMYEEISNTYLMLAAFLLRAPRDVHGAFLEAHNRAVSLRGMTPKLMLDGAYGHYVFEKDLAKAESMLLELRRRTPGCSDALARLAMVYLAQRRLDEALAVIQPPRPADELLAPFTFVEILVRYFRREFEEAAKCGKRALALHPSSQFGRVQYASALELAGHPEEALVQYSLAAAMAPDIPEMLAQKASCLARLGRVAEAENILEEIRRRRGAEYVDAYRMAHLAEALGRRDEAFLELERAYEEGSYFLLFLDISPLFDPLKTDPRFASLRRKVSTPPSLPTAA